MWCIPVAIAQMVLTTTVRARLSEARATRTVLALLPHESSSSSSSSSGIGGAVEWQLATMPCKSSDPFQNFSFSESTGHLTFTTGGNVKLCARVKASTGTGCNLGADVPVVLAPCPALTAGADTCSVWRLRTPAHPVNSNATYLVAPGSPDNEPRCLENPNGRLKVCSFGGWMFGWVGAGVSKWVGGRRCLQCVSRCVGG